MQTMSTVKKSIITAVCIALCYVLRIFPEYHMHQPYP